jgi:hypothetical protein
LLQALQILLFVGRRIVALSFPQDLCKTIDHAMLSGMRIANFGR